MSLNLVKNICWMKTEDAVDHSRVTREFKKFCLDYKDLPNPATSAKPKTDDSKAVAWSHKSKFTK